MTYLLFILALFIWPFGQLLNFSLPGLSLIVYPLDIACGLLTLSLWGYPSSRKQILRDPLFKPLIIFLAIATFSLLFNFPSAKLGGLDYALFYLLRLFLYPALYFTARQLPARQTLKPVFFTLTVFSLLGLLQYLIFPDMRFLKNLGFDDHYYRLVGTFYDPNFSGAIYAAVSLFFLAPGSYFLSLPFILLLAFTFSRASYLVFLMGVLYLLITQKKWTLLFYLFLLGSLIVLIPKPFGEGVNLLRTFSIFSRFDSWQSGLSLFLQKPLLGWGYNTLRSFNGQRFQIDNSYLYLAATTGILGLISFLNLLKHLLFRLTHLPTKVFILALLAHSLFNNSLFYIWIFFAFWLVAGLPLKEYKES